LFTGDFRAQGSDLVITGQDGARVEIGGFFLSPQPPDLISADGVRMAGWLVAEVAAPASEPDDPAPGSSTAQIAQAGAPRIGVAQTVTGEVVVTHVDGTRETLRAGDPVYAGDDLVTGKDGAIGIVFLDDTTFALAENGQMVLDEMIYDPGALEGSAVLSVVRGTFTFVSGQIAKLDPDGMVLKTPSATIGIRGTAGTGDVDDVGATRAALLEEKGLPLGEMVFNPDSANPVVLNVINSLVTIVTLPNADQHLPDSFRSQVQQIQQNRNDDTGNTNQPGQDAGGQDDPGGQNDENDSGTDEARATDDINLDVIPGETTGLLGPSGEGKTTPATDIPDFIPVTRGRPDKDILPEVLNPNDPKNPLRPPFNPLDPKVDGDPIPKPQDFTPREPENSEEDDDNDEIVVETPTQITNNIKGTGGADVVNGTAGADNINAGDGNDTVNAGAGNDTVNAGAGNDVVDGGDGIDIINGEDGDDTLQGGNDPDIINGAAGNDIIDGGNGADNLRGNAGMDLLIGGLLSDTLFGGPDADKFRINDPQHGTDSLLDFVSGTDVLELLKTAFNNPDKFLTSDYTAAITNSAGSAAGNPSIIVYDGTGLVTAPVVFYDQDGNNNSFASTALAVLPQGTTAALSDVSLI